MKTRLFRALAGVLLFLVVVPTASAAKLPSGFANDRLNGGHNPGVADGVISFLIHDQECSNVDYDERHLSDCDEGNVRSTIFSEQQRKLGEAVEYKFDLLVDPSLQYRGWRNAASQGFLPGGWDSHLRIASWEGPYKHNFIYMLKLDALKGMTFLGAQCQAPADFGKWVSFSLRILWTGDNTGWIRATCDGKTIYDDQDVATNQSPNCWESNECEPWVDKNPKTVSLKLGPVMEGWGPDYAKQGSISRFETIQKDGITLKIRNPVVRTGAQFDDDTDAQSVQQLKNVLVQLGCLTTAEGDKLDALTRDAALYCRHLPDQLPARISLATISNFTDFYSKPETAALPAGVKPAAVSYESPKYQMTVAEVFAKSYGKSHIFDSIFKGTIKGAKKGQDSLEFGLTGDFLAETDQMSLLALYIVEPLSSAQSANAKACGAKTILFLEGTEQLELPFTRVDDKFVPAADLSCVLKTVPATDLRQINFLMSNFRDFAVSLFANGRINGVRNLLLRDALRQFATGELTLAKS